MLWTFAVKSDWPATSSFAFAASSGVACALGDGEGGVPIADGGPASIARGLCIARVAHDEAPGHDLKLRRHGDIFEVDAGNAIDLPAVAARRGLAGRHAGICGGFEPGGLANSDGVAPVRWQD